MRLVLLRLIGLMMVVMMVLSVDAFQACRHIQRPSQHTRLFAENNANDNKQREDYYRGDNYSSDQQLDDLVPPSVTFDRNSMLFGDDPPSQRKNAPLRIWRGAKQILPNFVTGAWAPSNGDKKPVENLYNTLFVRIPTVLMCVVYTRNLLLGHGLIINFGGDNIEVPSLIVYSIILVILR